MTTHLYGRRELPRVAHYELPRAHRGLPLLRAARHGSELWLALGDAERCVVVGYREGVLVLDVPCAETIDALHVHRGVLYAVTASRAVLRLQGGALVEVPGGGERPAAGSARTAMDAAGVVRGSGPDAIASAAARPVIFLYVGTSLHRFVEGEGWTREASPELEWGVSLAVRDGRPVIFGGRAKGYGTVYVVAEVTDRGVEEWPAKQKYPFMKSAQRVTDAVVFQGDELGRVVGTVGYELVRYEGKGKLERPGDKWQLSSVYPTVFSATACHEYRQDETGVAEHQASLAFAEAPAPRLAVKGAKKPTGVPPTAADAMVSGPRARTTPADTMVSGPRARTPPAKIMVPNQRFFDTSLLGRDAMIDGVHFVGEGTLLVFGQTRRELVVHEYVLRDGAFAHVARHATKLLLPAPPTPGIGHGLHMLAEPEGRLFVVGRAQLVFFDLATRTLRPLLVRDATFVGRAGEHVVFRVDTSGNDVSSGLFVVDGAGKTTSSERAYRQAVVISAGEVRAGGPDTMGSAAAGGTPADVWAIEGTTVERLDLRTLAVRARMEVPTALPFDVRAEGGRVVATAYDHGEGLLHRWALGESVEALPDEPWVRTEKYADLVQEADGVHPSKLVDASGEVRFVLDLARKNATAYVHGVSESGRWWVLGAYQTYEIYERTDEGLVHRPRVGEPTREEAFERLYPGFLAHQTRKRAIRQWQLAVAIHESLVAAGHAEPFSLSAFAALFPLRKIDVERMALVRDAVNCVHYLVDTSPHLAALRSLRYDVIDANEICSELYPQWDGEDATFDITDLRGIEACASLEEVDLHTSGDKRVDVAPLARLPKLRTLRLRGEVANLAALAACAGTLRAVSLDRPSDGVDALRAAGVAVDVASIGASA